MVLEADRTGCLREVLVIAAALSIQDPRERPAEQQPGGRRRSTPGSTDDGSDFLASSSSGTYLAGAARRAHRQPVPQAVREEFLHFLRVREWQDLHSQLRSGRAQRGA